MNRASDNFLACASSAWPDGLNHRLVPQEKASAQIGPSSFIRTRMPTESKRLIASTLDRGIAYLRVTLFIWSVLPRTVPELAGPCK